MPDRQALSAAFLERAGWGGALRGPLAGDASHRRYDRLTRPDTGESAVLMDAPPDTGEDVRPFTAIARHLSAHGLSAPAILAEDEGHGFVLMEDFGDGLFARLLERDEADETALYAAATDLLSALHKAPLPPDLGHYDPAKMADLACLAFDWYLAGSGTPVPAARRAAISAELETVLARLCRGPEVMVLRDYHAENLIWLPGRDGVARVGLLDFQDALGGHPAYDLVSLLWDARRDVPEALQEAMLARYLVETGQPKAEFRTAFAALGVQRNLRILGVFARLCLRDGKPGYLDLLPRVWGHLQRGLAHPALAPLKAGALAALPPPTPALCQTIREKCATRPTP
ncbi:aminoglycoside/choline kinase family phosphotransferase [Rhodovulum iodosum]|uniref:Aminoglycoside/choline kinase family phosphotransferase n=1 Tax=Rhodovulum iodosum TaxID=68291 RepID=A0ABV3XRK0_9RHOB|nr:phosphotransferase [Rhodovulum robiginosum]RSK30304.1 aminoglycoside phosphotransferase [Rhodovulum robiginosum]